MKVKFAPSRQYILDTLNSRLADVDKLINDDETRLAQLTAPGKLITGINEEEETRRLLQMSRGARGELVSQIRALESAVSPRVMAELDV